jgi:hypothetical protein
MPRDGEEWPVDFLKQLKVSVVTIANRLRHHDAPTGRPTGAGFPSADAVRDPAPGPTGWSDERAPHGPRTPHRNDPPWPPRADPSDPAPDAPIAQGTADPAWDEAASPLSRRPRHATKPWGASTNRREDSRGEAGVNADPETSDRPLGPRGHPSRRLLFIVPPVLIAVAVAASATPQARRGIALTWKRFLREVEARVAQAGPDPAPDPKEVVARKGFKVTIIRYHPGLLRLIKAKGRDRGYLANFAAFRKEWVVINGDAPFAFKTVCPPGIEPLTGLQVVAIDNPAAVVDASNFDEMRPWLEDIRDMVLEGDGTGRGTLPRSKDRAEPMEDLAAPMPSERPQ